MSRRRKPNGVRSRSRSKPNFGYSGGAGCVASSATADPSRKKKKSVRTVFAQSTRPPFRINAACLPESENGADAQHVDAGFDHVAAAHLILFMNALLVKWKGGAEDIVPLLIVVAYIYR